MMSESLQDIKDELVADQSEMCSGAEFSEIQNVNASDSAKYMTETAIDDLEVLLTSETEEELNADNTVVHNYTYEKASSDEHQMDVTANNCTEVISGHPSTTDNLSKTSGNSHASAPVQNSLPKKLVALPSEATVMVDGQKCVLRVDHSTGCLSACPIASDVAVRPLSTRLQGYPKMTTLLEARSKPMSESVNVGVCADEVLENSEQSNCSLEITCTTVTESESSPSETDPENSMSGDGLMTVLNPDELPESSEMLSDCSTVSAEHSPSTSTTSAPGSSEPEPENSSRQHRYGSVAGSRMNTVNHVDAKSDVLHSKANVAVCQPGIKSGVNVSNNKDSIVVSASNRVQNYLASLGLPVKRGRGRPRRKPLPPEELSSVLVLDGGSAVPLSDSELQSLPLLLSNIAKPAPSEMQTSIVIEQEDGTEKHIILATSQTDRSVDDSTAAENLSVGDISHGVFLAQEADGQDDQNNVTHIVMVPKKEPVKIAMRTSDVDLAKLKCQKCEFQALHSHQLQQHVSDEHADELSDLCRCRCCNFLFFTEDDLKEHFKSNHPKNMCSECGFMSEHMYVIRRHMQRHSLAGCECNICGRRYKDQYILKMHIKMRHMEPDVLFQCNLCSKMFTRKAHLKRHLRIHNPDKPYKCPHCPYRGCERSDITKHVLVHNQPQHTCDICGKSFRHIKNKELHLKRHRGQRDYKCVFCEFYGYTYTDIRKHQERKHTSPRSVACGRCCMTFKSDRQLQVHQQTECQPVSAAAIDSETADVADSSDVLLQYISDSRRLPADMQLVTTASEPMSSSDYKVFVNGNPDGLNLLEAQMEAGETISNAEIIPWR